MQYLVAIRQNKRRAHIWTGADTACRLYATGGLVQAKYTVAESSHGRAVCYMCSNVQFGHKPATNLPKPAKPRSSGYWIGTTYQGVFTPAPK